MQNLTALQREAESDDAGFIPPKQDAKEGRAVSFLGCQESREMWSGGACRKWSWIPLFILRHLAENKHLTSQDDRWSWGDVLRQNSVSVLTWPLTVEFAHFAGISTPAMFCFNLPAVQQLAPQISECRTIKSRKPIQASFNKPQREHVHSLPALLLGWCQALTVPGETQNAGLSADARPLHHSCTAPAGIPGVPSFWIISFTSAEDPPSVGSKALSYFGKSSIIQQALLNWK